MKTIGRATGKGPHVMGESRNLCEQLATPPFLVESRATQFESNSRLGTSVSVITTVKMRSTKKQMGYIVPTNNLHTRPISGLYNSKKVPI